jgi:hypothetical protein
MDLGPAPDDDSDFAAVLDEVPADQRADGWTGERRIGFLRVLWNGASVTEAARRAGMTTQSARRLRLRAPAFRASWDEAQAIIVDELADTAFERAVNGGERPVYSRGQLVGHRTVHHDRLLLSLLSIRDPENYAPIDGRERWKRLKADSSDEESETRK